MRSLLHAPRSRKRSIAAATLGALALIGSLLVATPAQALNDTGTGGVFVPATGRILDTKARTGGFSTPMEAGKYRTIKVAGLAGLPDDGSVGAVSLNATVGASTGNGTLIGRPDADSGRTTMLIYNGVSGEYTSNSATLAVASDGTIQVMTETVSRLILDVQGYYTANTSGTAAGGFVPVAKHLVDTRSGLGAPKATIAPGGSLDVQITGSTGIPAGASGVVVDLIAINTTDKDGYLTPYATGSTKPANALHYAPSVITAIQAQVPVSADGKITVANRSSTTNLVVDVQGYFTAVGKGGAVFTPSYGRAYDSRASGNTALAKNETRSIQIAGKAGIPVMGSGITAVTLTLIVAHGGSAGYAQAYADGTTNPGTTAINFQTDDIRTNTITIPLGANGKIALRNIAEATNYVVDVQGWYTNPGTPVISCPGYADRSWGAAVTNGDISCTVIAPQADGTNQSLVVFADGEDSDAAGNKMQQALSDTTQTTQTVTLTGTPGEHYVFAGRTSAAGSLYAMYTFTLGDWTQGELAGIPADAGAAGLTPTLVAAMDDEHPLPDAATIRYTVSAHEDGVTDPIASSETTDGTFTVPAGVLQADTIYYWTAKITGPSGYQGQTAEVTSPVWSFTTDTAADDAPTVIDDDGATIDGQGAEVSPGYDLTTPDDPTPPGKVRLTWTQIDIVSKSKVSSSYVRKPGITYCTVQTANTTCAFHGSVSVSAGAQTSLGASVSNVSSSFGVNFSGTVVVSYDCKSPKMPKNKKWWLYAQGNLYRYKIKSTVWGLGWKMVNKSGWKYAFMPRGGTCGY